MPEWAAFEKAASSSSIHVHSLRVLNAAGIDLDISGQSSSHELTQAGEALLAARNFSQLRERLLSGGIANSTEERAAWHTALRAPAPIDEVATERQRLNDFVRLADSARRWRHIVHIGLRGSDWGVRLAVTARSEEHTSELQSLMRNSYA